LIHFYKRKRAMAASPWVRVFVLGVAFFCAEFVKAETCTDGGGQCATTPATPICPAGGGDCAACTVGSDDCKVPYPNTPVCDTDESGKCVECNVEADCTGQKCSDGNTCVECNVDEDCTVSGQTCNNNECEGGSTGGSDWCPPDADPTKFCSIPVEGALVKITVPAEGPIICHQPGTLTGAHVINCASLEKDYPDINTINGPKTCKEACNLGSSPCKAFTYVKTDSTGPDECYFLESCVTAPTDEDLIPCDGKNQCFSGKYCDGAEKPDCSGSEDCAETEVCAAGKCVEAQCTTPSGINHDYTKPQNQHWSVPCQRSDGKLDEGCNIYLDDLKCQDETVCTLSKCKGVEVKHTCKQGKWYRQDEEITADNEQDMWKEPTCQECETLTVVPEEGLGLICLNSDEPEFKDGTLQANLGPCNLYCDGIYVNHIRCGEKEDGTYHWLGDYGEVDIFYCWKNPKP